LHRNVEIKARCRCAESVRQVLRERGAVFRGVDHQVDTYFRCPNARLKLREGNIERALIFYDREDELGPKRANVVLWRLEAETDRLKSVLTAALGVRIVVEKRREIYFIDNVKFHIDSVPGLGDFVEIEAIDEDGSIGLDALQEQCESYLELFGIPEHDLLAGSYSDMLER